MNNGTKTANIPLISNEIFAANPKVKRLFMTNDGQAFALENNADQHSRKLPDKTITEVFSPEMDEPEIEEFKATEIMELEAGTLASFKRANPKLSSLITANMRNPRQ